jgi:hypothetical protein
LAEKTLQIQRRLLIGVATYIDAAAARNAEYQSQQEHNSGH